MACSMIPCAMRILARCPVIGVWSRVWFHRELDRERERRCLTPVTSTERHSCHSLVQENIFFNPNTL